ncbi:DUF362 domain-containing protein [Candidatus Woesearchaeota archaeon]|nr:DUF362 domain-containing protein [Candidatus Woesearchaeota archaeon]
MSKVAIVKCYDYDQVMVDHAIKKAIAFLGGIEHFVKKDFQVLIKPNMLSAKEATFGINTNPAVLKAVVKLVQTAGGIAFIGDSSAFSKQEKAYAKSGFADVAKETGAKLVTFIAKKFDNLDGVVSKSFELHKDVFEYDLIINLPKLKTHMLTDYTGAVKNLYGLMPGLKKSNYHLRFKDKLVFTQMLVDLYLMITPELNIMDAIISMEGEGPASGDLKKTNLILASPDALCLDLIATKIVGLENTPLHTVAKERKLISDVQVVGEKLDSVLVKDFKKPTGYKPSILQDIASKVFTLNPYLIKKNCISCAGCETVCPTKPKTIKMEKDDSGKKFPVFDYKHCIHCYCCHESCPAKAIGLKRKIL